MRVRVAFQQHRGPPATHHPAATRRPGASVPQAIPKASLPPAAKVAKQHRRARRAARVVAGAAAAAVVDGGAVGVTAAMKAGVVTVLRPFGLSNPRASERSAAPALRTRTGCLPTGNS